VDPTDLKLGGRFAFVAQRNYPHMLEDVIGKSEKSEMLDLPLLKLLDELPSLDPFLLREELARNGYKPASCYLELSDADLKQIFAFVQSEIEPLVRMSLGGKSGLAIQTAKLVAKILSNSLDSDMDPLRQVLRLSESDFAEGVFCWKGFLYYKWIYQSVAATSDDVIKTISLTRPMGRQDIQTRERLNCVRATLKDRIFSSSGAIKIALDIYDHAYAELTEKGNPLAFREFLLNAPARFAELGERLGVLEHITSFCQFRFAPNKRVGIGIEELLDIFDDFEMALYTQEYFKTPGHAAA
jgi:hypothetical protein